MTVSVDRLFALLGDETRRRLVVLLARHGELCVCELVSALDMVQPRVSTHLAKLRMGGVSRAQAGALGALRAASRPAGVGAAGHRRAGAGGRGLSPTRRTNGGCGSAPVLRRTAPIPINFPMNVPMKMQLEDALASAAGQGEQENGA